MGILDIDNCIALYGLFNGVGNYHVKFYQAGNIIYRVGVAAHGDNKLERTVWKSRSDLIKHLNSVDFELIVDKNIIRKYLMVGELMR